MPLNKETKQNYYAWNHLTVANKLLMLDSNTWNLFNCLQTNDLYLV